MPDHPARLHLAATNSGRRTAEKPLIKHNPLRLAGGLDVEEQAGAIGKSVRLPPIADSAGKKPKTPRKGAGAAKGVHHFGDGRLSVAHGETFYSSRVNKVKPLEHELTCPDSRCLIGGMARAEKTSGQPLNPRSLEAIAQRLLDTRLALTDRDTSQAAYAERAGIARNTYNQWEQAKGRPRLDEAIMLCDRYQLSLDWIYLGRRSALSLQIAERIPLSAE